MAYAFLGSNPSLPTNLVLSTPYRVHSRKHRHMAKKGNREWTWMAAKTKGESTYRFQTSRNKVNLKEKLEIVRYAPDVKKHVLFKEIKESKKK